MPIRLTYDLVAWSISFLLYFSLLFFFTLLLQEHSVQIQKYTASKKNMLNVTLVERKLETPKIKKEVLKITQTPKNTPIKTETKIQKSTIAKNTPVPLKNLFADINITKPLNSTKKQVQQVRKKESSKPIQEVQRQKEASKIIDALKLQKQSSLIVTQKDGIYDPFKGKISDILDTYWQETIDTVSGNEARVLVSIDQKGNFSYSIETLSYNDDFNAKLREFLEMMREVVFPAYSDGDKYTMQVVFKDILE
ncbi:MAG: TonB C-terminal domain-containing protein [Sulfurospirillum sp.]|nr:TonB C-terminal domain-containing protein [Sulfurospirillum sp.]